MARSIESVRTRLVIVGFVAAIYLAATALLVLSPSDSTGHEAITVVQHWLNAKLGPGTVDYYEVDFLLNIVMTIPLGLIGMLLIGRSRVLDWTGFAYLAFLSVEVVQSFVLPGRDGSYTDIVANTFGAFLGAVLGGVLRGLVLALLRLARRGRRDGGQASAADRFFNRPTRRHLSDRARYVVVGVAAAIYLSVAAVLVLNPVSDRPGYYVVVATEWMVAHGFGVNTDQMEFLLNVVLTVPLGALGMLMFWRSRVTEWAGFGFLAFLAVEVFQQYVLQTRDGSFRDIVANSFGAFVGAAVAWWFRTLLDLVGEWLSDRRRVRAARP